MTDNLLIEAKNLAIENIQDMLKDHIYNGILIIYNTSLERNKSETLKLFQKSLSSIRTSSDYVLREDYKFLCQSLVKNGRSELELTSNVENIFLCYAKLALIGRGLDTSKKLKVSDLDIPTNIYFLHQSYINSAREIYHNAYLYSHKFSPEQRIKNKLTAINIIKDAIKKTINECVHVDTILKKYIANGTDIEQHEIIPDDTDENVNNLMNFNIDNAIAEQDKGTDIKDNISRKLTGKNIAELQKALVNINKQDIETFKTSVGTGLTSIDLSASKFTKNEHKQYAEGNEIKPVSFDDQNKNSLNKENPEDSIMKSFNDTLKNTENTEIPQFPDIVDNQEMEETIQETKPIQFTENTEIGANILSPIEFTENTVIMQKLENSESNINLLHPIEFTEITEIPIEYTKTTEFNEITEKPENLENNENPIEFTEQLESSQNSINFNETSENINNPVNSLTEQINQQEKLKNPPSLADFTEIAQQSEKVINEESELISIIEPNIIKQPIESDIPVHKSDVTEFNDGYISEDFIKSIILEQFNQNVDKSFNKFKDYASSISKK